MDKVLNHFETMVETIVCWYLQGNRHDIPVFLWYPQYLYECLILHRSQMRFRPEVSHNQIRVDEG